MPSPSSPSSAAADEVEAAEDVVDVEVCLSEVDEDDESPSSVVVVVVFGSSVVVCTNQLAVYLPTRTIDSQAYA